MLNNEVVLGQCEKDALDKMWLLANNTKSCKQIHNLISCILGVDDNIKKSELDMYLFEIESLILNFRDMYKVAQFKQLISIVRSKL